MLSSAGVNEVQKTFKSAKRHHNIMALPVLRWVRTVQRIYTRENEVLHKTCSPT